MFKEKQMRKIVEGHLHQINTLLDHSKQYEMGEEIINNYISQKLALEYVLRDFDRIGVK